MDSAIEYAKYGLELHPQHIPFWHLLVLETLVLDGEATSSKSEYQALHDAWELCEKAEKTWMAGSVPVRSLLTSHGGDYFNFALTKARIRELLHKSHLDNNRKSGDIQKKGVKEDIRGELLSSYQHLFRLYLDIFFPGVIDPDSCKNENPFGFRGLEEVLEHFSTGYHHPFPSLYSTAPSHTDPQGFIWTSVTTVIERDLPNPIHYQEFKRLSKLRWMEWCIGLAHAFVHCGLMSEARDVCQYARTVERGNADVENLVISFVV